MKKCCNIILLAFSYLMYFNAASYTQTINARFTTSVYSWQQQENDSSSANHIRAYQLAQLTIGNLGLSGLSFHTYLNLSHDFNKEAVNDPRLWIYNCYFNLRNVAHLFDLSLGRQRIYAGVGFGTIDGLQIKYHFRDYFKIKLYAGTLAPLRKSYKLEKLSRDNFTWGVHITTAKLNRVKIGLSFAQHSRAPIKYATPGKYTGTFRMNHPLSNLQKRLLGLDLSAKITQKIRLNGRVDYNLALENVKRAELGNRYIINKDFEIGLDYIYRTPVIDLNSIFSVFDQKANQEIRLFTNYRWKNNRFFFNLGHVFFDGNDTQRIGFGWSWRTIYLGYHRRSGYGGDSDGVSANMTYPLQKKLNIIFNSNFSSYKLFQQATERDHVLAGSLGINYRPNRYLTLQSELQLLRNVRFDRDVRFFFRGSYAFFNRIGH